MGRSPSQTSRSRRAAGRIKSAGKPVRAVPTPDRVSGRSAAGTAGHKPSIGTLIERNYPELRRIAARQLRSSRLAGTMSPTSLVSESVVRLMRQRTLPREPSHLRGLTTILMAQAMSDRMKLRRAAKRGKHVPHSQLTPEVHGDRRRASPPGSTRQTAAVLPAVQQSLLAHMSELTRTHPRMMEIVTLHLVLDVPMPRIAELLGISERTGYRELSEGRRKLARRLSREIP